MEVWSSELHSPTQSQASLVSRHRSQWGSQHAVTAERPWRAGSPIFPSLPPAFHCRLTSREPLALCSEGQWAGRTRSGPGGLGLQFPKQSPAPSESERVEAPPSPRSPAWTSEAYAQEGGTIPAGIPAPGPQVFSSIPLGP